MCFADQRGTLALIGLPPSLGESGYPLFGDTSMEGIMFLI